MEIVLSVSEKSTVNLQFTYLLNIDIDIVIAIIDVGNINSLYRSTIFIAECAWLLLAASFIYSSDLYCHLLKLDSQTS